MTRPLCIYHANCQDGFTAAWVVWKALDGDCDFHPGVYQDPPPDVTDRVVYLVDFSYKREVVKKMLTEASQLTILDHHKSALEDLLGLSAPNLTGDFDLNRSGAGITWDYFFAPGNRPQLVNHVEDRDLWRFVNPRTRDYSARLFAEDYDFDTWDAVNRMQGGEYLAFCDQGAAINKKHMKDVRELVKTCQRPMRIGGKIVPAASLPYTLTSDAGNLMAQDVAFAACYWDTPAGRVFSLRSVEGGDDVALVAQAYGGGGHKHASGFRIPFNQLEQFEP